MNLLVAFLTGLTTGGLSCLAMQGGLLTSVIANGKKRKSNATFDQLDWLPVVMFLVTKLIVHTAFGFLLGLLGSVLSLSLPVRLAFQGFTALFMFATAMNLLDVHPIFRFVVFQPPKFIQRKIRNSTKSQAIFAPAVLGAFTIFVPCGVTQAMEVAAMNSGSPFYGAAIMFAFVLGTSPLFGMIGVATARLSETVQKSFMRFASYALIVMALYSLNGVLVVLDAPITFQKVTRPITYYFSDERLLDMQSQQGSVVAENDIQKVKIDVLNSGYSPRNITVKAGTPVELTLQSNQVYSCALAFTFKEFGISTFLDSTDTQTFTFTPTKKGTYTFTCSMGMYTGTMRVI